MNSAAFSALSGWAGGVISWLIAAAFDYQARENALSKRIGEIEIELKYDPKKGEDYGLDPSDDAKKRAEKLSEAAANQIGGKPGFWDSLQETYTQPLFVGCLTGGVGLFSAPQNRQIGTPLLLWVAVTAGTIVIALLNGKRYQTSSVVRHWAFIGLAWLVVFAVFAGAAWSASQADEAGSGLPAVQGGAPDRPDGG